MLFIIVFMAAREGGLFWHWEAVGKRGFRPREEAA